MNPRASQYALAGTLHAWTRLDRLSRRQSIAMRTAYRGWNPMVYSRYGERQWAAPLPWTGLVVKDPFAMLSLPVVAAATGARVVLVFRHPAAVLASYRRMGWSADLDEVTAALDLPSVSTESEATSMAMFWSALHEQALRDLPALHDSVVVSHEAVAAGGTTAVRAIGGLLGLAWDRPVGDAPHRATAGVDPGALHNFDRPSAEVAGAWRADVDADEVDLMESIAGSTLASLRRHSLDRQG
jgi:hypothetical protein